MAEDLILSVFNSIGVKVLLYNRIISIVMYFILISPKISAESRKRIFKDRKIVKVKYVLLSIEGISFLTLFSLSGLATIKRTFFAAYLS